MKTDWVPVCWACGLLTACWLLLALAGAFAP